MTDEERTMDADEAQLAAMAARAGVDPQESRLELETLRAVITSVRPGSPVWELQQDITRQVLAKLSPEELEQLLADATGDGDGAE